MASIAAFALPRSAGAVTRTFSVVSSQPAMPFLEAPGTALIWSLMPGFYRPSGISRPK